jgi:hypothetical protein
MTARRDEAAEGSRRRRKATTSKTDLIVVEQSALEPWSPHVDLYDAAIVNHVVARLTWRRDQKIVEHPTSKLPCAWCDLETVRGENWLIGQQLSAQAISRRLKKLVSKGILIRYRWSKVKRGTRLYLGISDEYRRRRQEVEGARQARAPRRRADHERLSEPAPPRAEAPSRTAGSYEPPEQTAPLRAARRESSESMYMSQGPKGVPTDGTAESWARGRRPRAPQRSPEEQRAYEQYRRGLLQDQARKLLEKDGTDAAKFVQTDATLSAGAEQARVRPEIGHGENRDARSDGNDA